MIVFISDLHFVDGSAGEHNVPTEAFHIFFEDIGWTAERLRKRGGQVEEIKIVFLGDIFDVIRTEKWFSIPISERPWGSNEKKIESHTNMLFDEITSRNQDTFSLLSGKLEGKYSFQIEPERIYIPGNHDRLCNKYKSLRKKVRKNLGIPSSDTPFEHSFIDVDYGVFARHGHEFDKFNYEGGTSYNHDDYMRVPIGDTITTELLAKLPWQIMQHPAVKNLKKGEQPALRRNLQEIENVRPFSATLEWLLYQVKNNLSIKEAIEDSVDEVVKEFNKLRFVKKWYEHHDKWDNFMDKADQIQSVLFLLEKFKIFPSEKLLPLLAKVKNRLARDDYLEAALKENALVGDGRINYIVYGHTHEPRIVPLRRENTPNGPKDDVYLNTGTWRTRYHRCKEGLGFTGWKNLTYLVFYRKEERDSDLPAFETWTGTLKTI
jgi:UDP-2,3-diacylglucosamine pyrophosphatase LpxH